MSAKIHVFQKGLIVITFLISLAAPKSVDKSKDHESTTERQHFQNSSSAALPLLFADPDDQRFSFPVFDVNNTFLKNWELDINKDALSESNITAEQLKEGRIQATADGKKILLVDGEEFEISMLLKTVVTYQNDKGKSMFSIDMDHFAELTMDDIKDDPTLVPIPPLNISWSPVARCSLDNISILVTGSAIQLKMNDNVTSVHNISRESEGARGRSAHVGGEGLLLAVVDPRSCRTSLEVVALTSDVSGYRDLIWALKSILPGNIVLLASLRDGAAFLNESVWTFLSKLGSLWSDFYMYRDTWLNVFVKGGRTIQEVLVPNTGNFNTSAGPVQIDLDVKGLVPHQDLVDCPSWPSSERWEARKVFCKTHGGFAGLCQCEHPLQFRHRNDSLDPKDNHFGSNSSSIPIIIIIGNRTRHLFHLFESLWTQRGVCKEDVLLVTDGHRQDAARLAYILGLPLLVHSPEGTGPALISRNLRFALYNALRQFPAAKAFILLEDDLVLAPDFYSFMTQMEPIFGMDSSIFCVSAFNHVSYRHTSRDPSLTYRVRSYPAYGWMMPRSILQEIVPKWLPTSFDHDWDYFVGSTLVMRDRECVIPDVNRSYHWSTQGFHLRASYAAEIMFLSRNLNLEPNVKLQPLERLIKDNYEREFTALLNESIPIPFTVLEAFDAVISPGEVYAIYVTKQNFSDSSSFRFVGEEFEIWTYDSRDHHDNVWRFFYKNSTVLVVGVPLSAYSSYMPEGYPILQGNASTDFEISASEFYYRMDNHIRTHFNFSNLPDY